MILCGLAGVLCGFAAVAFHLSIDFVFEQVLHFADSFSGAGKYAFLILSPAVGGLLVGVLIYCCAPHAVGSGIPQTKQAYYNDFGRIKLKEGFWRLTLGTIYVGLGNSLGREGPTVHMCSAIASTLGQWAGLAKARVQAMVPVGMAAGIAAAFNTPIAAITFVFEELLDDFSTKALGGILIAVVIAGVIERSVLGHNPVFSVDFPAFETDSWMLICLPLGIAAGLIGHLFVSSVIHFRLVVREFAMIPVWLRPCLGGLACGLIATAVYLLLDGNASVFSIGYDALDNAFAGNERFIAFALLFVAKLIVVVICYTTGGSGGLFSPTIFCGGMLGGMMGVVLVEFFGVPDAVVGACVFLGMGAFFAAVIRCPMTSILIIFEMTQNYSLILPLMAGNILAYYIAQRLRPVPLYDALLVQDGVSLRKMPNYQGAQDYQNLPISTIMTHDSVVVYDSLSAKEMLQQLDKKVHHGYPMVNAEGQLSGMVMHHELEETLVEAKEEPLGVVFGGRNIISVEPQFSIRDVATTLIREDVLQVPVVSPKDSQKLLGVVTLHDIARQQNAFQEQISR